MKISLNSQFFEGPAGGGMKFANLFRDYLKSKRVEVVNNLKDDDIDIIFHITPFPFLMRAASYSFLDAYAYKMKHPKTFIVHRINECDERKGTNYMNKLLVETAKYSDAIIFIASWLKPLLEKRGLDLEKPSTVILHGADSSIFNTKNKDFWDKKRKMRLVTHHWGGHYMKGHDFYQRLDDLLSDEGFRDKFEFTYIGNYPKDLKYKNIRMLKPLSGEELAKELKRHDVYITASRNEPAGMHHVEGALCGLPLLYIDSGALKEYCDSYGLEFNEDNFEEKLLEMYHNYEDNLEKIKRYNRTSEKMLNDYYEFIKKGFDKYHNQKKVNNFKNIYYRVYSNLYNKFWKLKKKFK